MENKIIVSKQKPDIFHYVGVLQSQIVELEQLVLLKDKQVSSYKNAVLTLSVLFISVAILFLFTVWR